MKRTIAAVVAAAMLGACAEAPPPAPAAPPAPVTQPAAQPVSGMNYIRVPLYATSGGTPVAKVAIDDVCCFNFIVDSGASDVSVSPAVFAAMVKSGRVTEADVIDVVKYRTANGVTEGLRFRMPPLTIGVRTVYGVIGSVSLKSNAMLLGQSFLTKFRFWAIDNAAGVLVLG
jgi:predicted aspartyl protease